MRQAFSDALVRLALADKNVLLLTGDHGYALFDDFRRECPQQYINAGVAEQNMVGMAAGLARMGFRPFVYGLSAFIPVRVLEQIKLDIAHDNLPVVLLGDGAGFVYSHLGTSHQSTEDLACTRAIPQLAILSPSDRHEMTACMDLAYAAQMPVYLRMGKADRGDVHAGLPILSLPGEPLCLKEGAAGGVAILATGSMVKTALQLVETTFPEAAVWSVPVIKPLGEEALKMACRAYTRLVTLEEHAEAGGLGSLVAELISETEPRPLLRIGVRDRFSEHCGTYDYLLHEHGLDLASVATRIGEFLNRVG